jgi:Fic family protein
MYLAEAPGVDELLGKLGADSVRDAAAAEPDPRSRSAYLHWDKLHRLKPPAGLSAEQWWLKIKLGRREGWSPLPLQDRGGVALGYTIPGSMQQSLHWIDQRSADTAGMKSVLPSRREARERLFVNSLMEEAIRSSQLEGAATSRGDAKALLLSGRAPRDRGEQMIANNYRALQFMSEQPIGAALTPATVLELHRIVTDRTLADPASAGRLQQPGEERVRVYDRDGGRVVFLPPPAEQLPDRMRRLCDFANAGGGDGPFVHPVLRAILLHFWLAYDHPFLDGNGRTARILFFWAMRTRGYWLAEYLPISRLIREAPAQYGEAFLKTETDGGDVTYFLLQQLEVVERAIEGFGDYIKRKADEQRDVRQRLSQLEGINGRQLVLLTHAVKHPDHTYTFSGHARSNLVTHETARADLGRLAERGLLVRRRRGRAYVFEPAPDLPERLRESGA